MLVSLLNFVLVSLKSESGTETGVYLPSSIVWNIHERLQKNHFYWSTTTSCTFSLVDTHWLCTSQCCQCSSTLSMLWTSKIAALFIKPLLCGVIYESSLRSENCCNCVVKSEVCKFINSKILNTSYFKETEPLYHSLMYSLVSLHSVIYPFHAMHSLLVTIMLD